MVKRTNYENIANDIIKISKELKRGLRQSEFKEYGIKVDPKRLKSYFIENTIYTGYMDFSRKNMLPFDGDILLNSEYKGTKELTLDDLKQLFNEYKDKYGIFPNSCICLKKNIDNIPPWHTVQKIYNENHMTLNEFLEYIGNVEAMKSDVSKYDEYIKIIKEKCISRKQMLSRKDYLYNTLGIPDYRWLIQHCPNKDVTNYNKFVAWLGFIPSSNISKECAIEAILCMSKKYNRPLMYDDFRSPGFNEIGIGSINKIWGSMNKMKLELKLEVIQESMIDKIRPIAEMKSDLIRLCNEILLNENRRILTTKDIDKCEYTMNVCSYRKYFKLEGSTTRDFLKSIGFNLQLMGRGLNYTFEDGEKTVSQYELDFSNYLRNNLNLKYNVDYYRDVRYKTFINNYNNLMDCDYVINYEGRKIYIEVTGLLRDYDKNYYGNKPIKSKSKEKYRLKLMKKEAMLKSIDNAEYYLIFPINKNYNSVLDFDNINKIFN